MKLTIDRSTLVGILAHGASAATRNAIIPITSHVRLVAESDGKLYATSTSLDLQADAYGDADIEECGEVAVAADALRQYIDRLPSSAKVRLEIDGPKLVVSTGRQRARFATLPAADFVTLDMVEGEDCAEFVLKSADLAALFARILPAADRGSGRIYLEGIFLHAAHGELRGVATNGHVLLMSGVEPPIGSDSLPVDSLGRRGVIVSSESVSAATKLFGREEFVGVKVGSRLIEFSGSTSRLIAKLVEGAYPDHERIMPARSENLASVDRALCLSAIASIEVFHDRDGGNRLEIGEDRGGLAMAAGAGSDGDGFAVAEAEFSGSVPIFGASSKYLRTVLGAFQSEIVTLSVADPGSPILFFADNEPRIAGIVMPMKVTTSLLREAVQK